MRNLILLLAFALISASLHAQQTDRFKLPFGGVLDEQGFQVRQTSDKGYWLLGSTSSIGQGSSDLYWVRTDSTGLKIFDKAIGGANADQGYGFTFAGQGRLAFVGTTASFGDDFDAWVGMCNAQGDTLWTRHLGGTGWGRFNSIAYLSDGHLVAVGQQYDTLSGANRGFMAKLDTLGNIVWELSTGSAPGRVYHSVYPCAGGGFLVCGQQTQSGTNGDAVFARYTSGGSLNWQKLYSITGEDALTDIIETWDQQYIMISGYTESRGAGGKDFWLLRCTPAGDTLWTATTGGPDNEQAFGLCEAPDGRYALIGLTAGPGYHQALFSKLDFNGMVVNQTTYNAPPASVDVSLYNVDMHSIKWCADSGFVMAGTLFRNATQHSDAYLIKSNAVGGTLTALPVHQAALQELAILENPSQGGIVLANRGSGLLDVSVYTTLGTVAAKTQLKGGELQHRIGPLTPGVYVLTATQNSRNLGTLKVLVH